MGRHGWCIIPRWQGPFPRKSVRESGPGPTGSGAVDEVQPWASLLVNRRIEIKYEASCRRWFVLGGDHTMRKFAVLAVMAALIVPSAAFAVTGTIQATANVLTPLSVSTDLRALDFGDVFPGLNKSIAFTDGTSGKWQIGGEAAKEIQLAFTLPAALDNGGILMPISFSATDAAYFGTDVVGSAVAFDPSGGSTENLDAAGTGFVWLGGTVQPTANQAAGVYAATVSLDVVYTGN